MGAVYDDEDNTNRYLFAIFFCWFEAWEVLCIVLRGRVQWA